MAQEKLVMRRFHLLTALLFSVAAALCGAGIAVAASPWQPFSLPLLLLHISGSLFVGGAATGFYSASWLAGRAHAFNKRTAHRRSGAHLPWHERLSLFLQGFKYGALIITLSFVAAGFLLALYFSVTALLAEPAYPEADTLGAKELVWMFPASVLISLPYALPALPVGGMVGVLLFATKVRHASRTGRAI